MVQARHGTAQHMMCMRANWHQEWIEYGNDGPLKANQRKQKESSQRSAAQRSAALVRTGGAALLRIPACASTDTADRRHLPWARSQASSPHPLHPSSSHLLHLVRPVLRVAAGKRALLPDAVEGGLEGERALEPRAEAHCERSLRACRD
jgi:hypothetical protein